MKKLLDLVRKLNNEVEDMKFREAMVTLREVRKVLGTYQNAY